MNSNLELALRIRVNRDGSVSVLGETADQVRQISNQTQTANRHLNDMTGIFGTLRNAAVGAFVGLGIAEMTREFFNVNKELNTTRNLLDQVTGSTAAGTAQFQNLKNYGIAAITGVSALGQAYARLNDLALTSSETILTGYANIAARNPGKKLNDVIEAVADAATGEYERLKEFGIKAAAQGDQVALTFKGVTTTIKNSADGIQSYLSNIGNTAFAGAIASQLNTMEGAFTHLGNSISTLFDDVMTPAAERFITNVVNGMADVVSSIDRIPDYLVSLGDTTASIGDIMSATWLTVKNVGLDMIDGLSSTFPYISQAASMVASAASAYFKMHFSVIGQAAAATANFVIGAFNALGNSIGAIAAGIVNNFGQAFAKVKAMAAGIASGVKAAMSGDFAFADLNTAFTKQSNFVNVAADVKTALGKAFSVDYVGNLGKQIKSTAADLHMIRTMTDAHGQAMLNAKKHADNLAGAVGGSGGAHKKAAEHAGHHAKALSGLTDAQKEHKKLTEDGTRLVESLATAQEKAAAEFANATRLYNANAIGLATLDRALVKYREDLEKTTPLVKQLKDAESTAGFAKDLQDMGYAADAVKDILAQYKETNDAIAANPGLKPSQVADMVGRKIAADKVVQDASADTAKTAAEKSAKDSEAAYKKMWENIQDAGAQMFDDLLSGRALASFESFAQSVGNLLNRTLSQSFSQALGSLFSDGATDWKGIIMGGVTVGASALASLLGKSKPTLTASASQTNSNSTQFGSGAQAIADSLGRDNGFNFQSRTVLLYNNAVADAKNALSTSAESIYNSIKGFGTNLLSSPAIANVRGMFSPLANMVSNAWTGTKDFIGNAADKAISWIGSMFSTGTAVISNTGSAFMKMSESVGSIWPATENIATTGVKELAGKAMAVFGAVYSVYNYISNIGDLMKTGNIQLIAGNTMAMAGSLAGGLTAVASMAGLIGPATAGIGYIVGGITALVGAVVSMFAKVRVPNTWLATRDAVGQATDSATWSDITANKRAAIGGNSRLGWTTLSSHEIQGDAAKREIIESFRPILNSILTVDNQFAGTIDRLDEQFGQAGETMRRYNAIISQQANYLGTKQNNKDLDVGKMIDERYNGIIDIMRRTGTRAGGDVAAWYDLFASKFSDAAKKTNPGYSLSIIQALSSRAENGTGFAEVLTQLPANAMRVLGDSIQALKADNPFKDLMEQAGGIIVGYMQAKLSFGALGDLNANDESIFAFVGRLTQVGIAANTASGYLVSFARSMVGSSAAAIKGLGQAVFDELGRVLDTLKARGLNGDQTGGYLSTYTLGAGLASDLGIAVTSAQLDVLSTRLNTAASSATQSANELINHAIADNKLGGMAREAAVQQLVLSGKLKDTDIAAANFGIALTKLQTQMNDGVGVASNVAGLFYTTLNGLALPFENLTNLGGALTSTFGDVGKGMDFLNNLAQSVLTPEQFNQAQLNVARNNFNSASKTLGFADTSIDFFKDLVKNQGAISNYLRLLSSTDPNDKAQAAVMTAYANAGMAFIKADQAANGTATVNKADTSLSTLQGLAKELGNAHKSALQSTLDDIQSWGLEYYKSADEIAQKLNLPLSVVKRSIADIADARMTAQLQSAAQSVKDFGVSIRDYVTASRIKYAGTPVDQFAMTQADAFGTYQLAMQSNDKAMGQITSKADAYLSAIDAAYGSSQTAVELRQQVYTALDALPAQVTVEEYIKQNNVNGKDILAQLQQLNAEVRALRGDSQSQTEALMQTTADSSDANAQTIAEAQSEALNRQLQALKGVPVLV